MPINKVWCMSLASLIPTKSGASFNKLFESCSFLAQLSNMHHVLVFRGHCSQQPHFTYMIQPEIYSFWKPSSAANIQHRLLIAANHILDPRHVYLQVRLCSDHEWLKP